MSVCKYTTNLIPTLSFSHFYNEYNNSIYLYNYHKPENYQIIHLEKEGPNGVYPYASGYHIKTLDSIYFYSMYVDKNISP